MVGDADAWYVFFNERVKAAKDTEQPGVRRGGGTPYYDALRTLEVHGPAYAFDKRTGARRWRTEMPVHCLVAEQCDELPMLLFAATLQRYVSGQRVGRGGHNQYSSALALDKRDGKAIGERPFEDPGNQFMDLRVDPGAGVVELLGSNRRVSWQVVYDSAAR